MRTATFYTSLIGATFCGGVACASDFLYGTPGIAACIGFAVLIVTAALVQPMATPDAG